MFNKESCKACGTYLTPISVCSVCKEYVSWLCGKCERMEDVTHSHAYYKAGIREASDNYKEDITKNSTWI